MQQAETMPVFKSSTIIARGFKDFSTEYNIVLLFIRKDIYTAIPDTSMVTLKDMRQRCAQRLGLPETGLNDKATMVKKFMSIIINDEPAPPFDDSGVWTPHAVVSRCR